MGKALPFLAFLFGYSMTSYSRRFTDHVKFKRRQYKLLLIGVLHGAVLYFGDILTAYALVGLWLGSAITQRGRELIARWRWWFLLWVSFTIFKLFTEWKHYQPTLTFDAALDLQPLSQALTYSQFAIANVMSYFGYTFGWLLSLYVPLHIFCLLLASWLLGTSGCHCDLDCQSYSFTHGFIAAGLWR